MRTLIIALAVLFCFAFTTQSASFSSDAAYCEGTYLKCSENTVFYRDQRPVNGEIGDMLFILPATYYVLTLTDADYAADKGVAPDSDYLYCEYAGIRGCVKRGDLGAPTPLSGVPDPYYTTVLYTDRNTKLHPLLSTDILDTDISVNTPLRYISYLNFDDQTYYYVGYENNGNLTYGYVSASDTTDKTIATTIPVHRNSRVTPAVAAPATEDELVVNEDDKTTENLILTVLISLPALALVLLFFFSGGKKKSTTNG